MDRPFIAINSVGLSKELLGSELFGYEQGAFTGAQRRKKGKVELAEGGTLFFDEIGDISQDLQAKLLKILCRSASSSVWEERTPIAVDVRVIAATNRDLERSVRDGLFREDLYHRLNVVAIKLSPLRKQREDLPSLMGISLAQACGSPSEKISPVFTDEVRERLAAYSWPGNVGELCQCDRTRSRAELRPQASRSETCRAALPAGENSRVVRKSFLSRRNERGEKITNSKSALQNPRKPHGRSKAVRARIEIPSEADEVVGNRIASKTISSPGKI